MESAFTRVSSALRVLDPDLIPTRLRAAPLGVAPYPRPDGMATSRERAYAFIRFLVRLLKLRFRGHLNTRTGSVEVRVLLECLGGTWIKLGQLMALRRDLFSWEFCQEMSKVQDRAIPFRTDVARQILERSLNEPLGSVFEDFSEPVAAASIGRFIRRAFD